MQNIQISARFKIQDDKLGDFKSLADSCMEAVRQKDKGTLQYDWFYNERTMECVVREKYTDSNAVLAHLGNVGKYLGGLLGIASLAVEIFGPASDDLKSAVEGMDVKYYSYVAGL